MMYKCDKKGHSHNTVAFPEHINKENAMKVIEIDSIHVFLDAENVKYNTYLLSNEMY